MTTATIAKDLVPVRAMHRPDFGYFLVMDAPNGWDDVKKMTKKVLKYEGRLYKFLSWNSDRNDMTFKETAEVAQIVKAR